jgi:BirA family transcriptional regulator, biotin operon repressor / biotin---[acetyl-CoA-carboxylase] ligase
MSPELNELYRRLADGRRHNGAELADELGISRAAVWKRIESLRRIGLQVAGTAGDGYRIERPIELLDADRIRLGLKHSSVKVEVVGAVDSTNARLAAHGPVHAHALVAEAQKAGRGRRGRQWLSPPGGIYLSLGWSFDSGLAGLAPLSLVVGMSVARSIGEVTGVAVKVKWPNDLVIDNTKLGGCLVEISGAAEGPCQAIIGIGINLDLPDAAPVDQPWTSLARHAATISRNQLVAALIGALEADLGRVDRNGFDEFARQWPELDALAGRKVHVAVANGKDFTGRAEGIDAQGRLLVEVNGQQRALGSGEVSVRGR